MQVILLLNMCYFFLCFILSRLRVKFIVHHCPFLFCHGLGSRSWHRYFRSETPASVGYALSHVNECSYVCSLSLNLYYYTDMRRVSGWTQQKSSILNYQYMWSEWTMVGLWKCDKHVIYLSNPNLDHKPLKNFLFFSGNSLMNEDISICRPDYGIKRSLKFCDSLGLFSSFFFSSFFLSLHFFNVFVI